jgi:hypothetical protein
MPGRVIARNIAKSASGMTNSYFSKKDLYTG